MSRARHQSHLSRLSCLAVILATLSCCTRTATVEPSISHLPSFGKAPKTVGVYFSPEFRSERRVVDSIEFKVGSASVSLLDDAFAITFDETVEIGTQPPVVGREGELSAVIEPRLEDFAFRTLFVGKGRHWAFVSYDFSLSTLDGELVASWRTKGQGESHGWEGQGAAVTVAMQQAAAEFVTSFRYVPELRRWAEDLPIEGATAPGNEQETRPAAGIKDGAVVGTYRDVVEVSAELRVPPGISTRGVGASRLTSVHVSIHNLSGNRLRVHLPDIALVPNGTGEATPLPPSTVSGLLTSPRVRLGPVAPGTGLAALPALAAVLADWAMEEGQKEEFAELLAAYESDSLRDTILQEAEVTDGFIYFAVPSRSGAALGTLLVPIVDLDSATRYVVRLPLRQGRLGRLSDSFLARGSGE